jgi:regulator of nucleoside diphosphate kinase
MGQAQALATTSTSNAIVLTDFDHRRLRGLIDVLRERGDDPTLDVLELELELAAVVDPKEIPPDVVTMNSTVEILDLDSKERRSITLVFPGTASVGVGRVSVLAPIGAALLGAHVGEEVTWPSPKGTRRARVETITYQPEAAGDWHL